MYEAGWTSDLGIIALRKWSLDERSAEGDGGNGNSGSGIIGVGGWIRNGKTSET